MPLTQETAIVSFIKGDHAYLKTNSTSTTCGSCASKSGCANVNFFSSNLKSAYSIRVPNHLHLKAGDSVILSMPSNTLLLATLLMYVFPLVLLFVFAGVGKSLGGESISILAGLAGLFAGLLVLKRFTKEQSVAKKFEPEILRKVISLEAK